MPHKKPEYSIYHLDPSNYDLVMGHELETEIFDRVVEKVKKASHAEGGVEVLDFCCGTGIVAEKLKEHNIKRFVGVDINRPFLESAKGKLTGKAHFEFVEGDAVDYRGDKFDIVVLSSAYHHIADEDKVRFLKNAKSHLKKNGFMVIYEKLIPKYSNREEWEKANVVLYEKRDAYLGGKLTKRQRELLQNFCDLSAAAEEEYKVDYRHFMEDLKQAGIRVDSTEKVWPLDEKTFNDPNVGDFIFIYRSI